VDRFPGASVLGVVQRYIGTSAVRQSGERRNVRARGAPPTWGTGAPPRPIWP